MGVNSVDNFVTVFGAICFHFSFNMFLTSFPFVFHCFHNVFNCLLKLCSNTLLFITEASVSPPFLC